MDIKFANLYSKNKRTIQENDITSFPILSSNIYYDCRQNNYIYNKDNKYIHHVRFFEKNKSVNFFYLNKYRSISQDIISRLPFDTKHFVTQEVIGESVYARKIDNKRYIFTKHNTRCNELENILRDEMKYKYIIDKYSKYYTLEFKLYNNVVYLVNMFNNDECVHFDEIKRIANQFDISVPKEVNSLVFRQGIKSLDNFYNDYYMNADNFIHERDYYITLYFKNKKTLLYKIIK